MQNRLLHANLRDMDKNLDKQLVPHFGSTYVYNHINYIQSKSGVFAPLNAREEAKKNRYAKNPAFDNKLHNEVVTYSKSTTMRHIYIYYEYYLLNLQYLISTKNYLINRQSEKRLHLKDKKISFSVQKTGDFASDPTL